MSISGPFIIRPIATSLVMVAILLAGFLAYQLLPISSLPQVDYPTMQVLTFYPGASPSVVASSITAPLEKQFGQMPGLAEMTSSSSSGASVVTLQFDLGMGLDVAEQEVQAAINNASNFLPFDLPFPPIYSKVNPADAPIITLGLTSKTMLLPQVEDFADTRLAQKIAELPGVGIVTLSGGQRPAVRVQANPTALASYGITLETVRTAIVTGNVNTAKGSFDGPRLAYTINANDQLLTSADYRPLIVAYRNGAPIRLTDIANVQDSVENIKQAAWMNETPAVIMNIKRQPGANVIVVADSIKSLLQKLRANLPEAIDISLLTDRTITIRSSIHDVQVDLLVAIVLVVIVIFFFLHHFAATLIPSIGIPLVIVGTFGPMYLLGFSLNNLTLIALTIATGFAADDAIVMIENISRYIENKETPLNAALKGSAQIGFTILSLTVSLIAVLIPLLFMGDIIGRLFREFAVTLSVTILLSAFISLTLTPMLCGKLLRVREANEMNRFEQRSAALHDYVIDHYGGGLRWVLNHQPFTLFIVLITLIISCVLFYIIPKNFFPVQDTGLIQGITQAAPSISFAGMAERQKASARVVLADPAVANLSSFIGIDGTNTSQNSGRMLITLKPIAERDASAIKVIERLQKKLAEVPGITLYMQPVQDLTVDTNVSRNQFQYSLSAPDAAIVTKWSDLLLTKLRKLTEIRDVATDQQNNGLQTTISIDRDTASRLGITMQMIDDILYDAFGQRQVSIIFTQRNQYRVILEVLPQLQERPENLENIYVNILNTSLTTTTANPTQGAAGGIASPSYNPGTGVYSPLTATTAPAIGSPANNYASAGSSMGSTLTNSNAIPLAAFTQISQGLAPLVITRKGQFPVATLSFNLAPNSSLGEALSVIDKEAQALHMPASIDASFEGAAKSFENSLANEGFLLLAAIVVVYIVLGILYESYIHPITILSTLPSASMGALLALFLTGNSLSVIALIGIILLIGIVLKNAIMMIDFALDLERQNGKTARDAIYEAALLRFRPILMTTLAMLFGAIPLALGGGMGSELRRPLGIVIIGGLIVSQLLTLFTTPVIYLAFDKTSLWVRSLPRRWFNQPVRDEE